MKTFFKLTRRGQTGVGVRRLVDRVGLALVGSKTIKRRWCDPSMEGGGRRPGKVRDRSQQTKRRRCLCAEVWVTTEVRASEHSASIWGFWGARSDWWKIEVGRPHVWAGKSLAVDQVVVGGETGFWHKARS